MKKLEELTAAFEAVPHQTWQYEDWLSAIVYIDGHRLKCAADFGKVDNSKPFGEFIAQAHNLMPLLLEAVDIVRSNYVGNARAEALLEKFK